MCRSASWNTSTIRSAILFATIRAIIIHNKGTGVADILDVGAEGTNVFINWVGDATDKIRIGPGGLFFLWNPSAAGYAVTAGTGDKLRIKNNGTGDTVYQIILVGSTAA